MRQKGKEEGIRVYQIKITLKDMEPPIWRRFQVRSDISLGKLHEILQTLMGWSDSHLHQFSVNGKWYAIPDPEFEFETKTLNERRVKLGQLISEVGSKFGYEYDFGNGWEHELEVEKVLPFEEGARYPIWVRPRIAAALMVMKNCWRSYGIRNIQNTLRDRNGWEIYSIRRDLILRRRINS